MQSQQQEDVGQQGMGVETRQRLCRGYRQVIL